MKVLLVLVFSVCLCVGLMAQDGPDKRLFIYGGNYNSEFINQMANLTNKRKPRVCFLPTASADNPYVINRFYDACASLDVEPHVLRVWINSYSTPQSWEEVLLSMDVIIVGGGNTLNMLAIWEAQGIDQVLRKAYDRGIILGGGSAGSLCWFTGGTTDSRPMELSIVEGLGFLDYSHCPHYSSEESRRPLYHQNIMSGKLQNGYACDDKAALLFVNGKVAAAFTLDPEDRSYYVYNDNGRIVEELIESELIK